MGYLDLARKVAPLAPVPPADGAEKQGGDERNEVNELIPGTPRGSGAPPPPIGAVVVPTALRRDHDTTLESRPVAVSGYCPAHRRLLTSRESESGRCSWCEPDRFEWGPKDRAAIDKMNAPPPARADFTCLECRAALPAGFKYYCPSCVGARAESADREVPF